MIVKLSAWLYRCRAVDSPGLALSDRKLSHRSQLEGVSPQSPVPTTAGVDDIFACSGSESQSCADACLGEGRRCHSGLWHRCLRHSCCWSAGRAPAPHVQVLSPRISFFHHQDRMHSIADCDGLVPCYFGVWGFSVNTHDAHKNVTLLFRVDLPGGPLQIEWREADNHVYMTGPALPVFAGSMELN